MTTDSEELVARLDDLILDQLLHLGRPGAELQMAARQVRQAVLGSGLLVSATASQAEVAGLRTASAADVEALSEATKLHFDALVKLQTSEAAVAGLRAALVEADRLLGGLRLGASIHNERTPGKRVEGPLWDEIHDVRVRNARALALHQEGKEG